jgi:hypothetical protein
MRKRKREKQARNYDLVAIKQPRHLPPPDSELWPEFCRGKLWNWSQARFFVRRCQLCAYACLPGARRRCLDKVGMMPTLLLCMNHPDGPGAPREVFPTEMCRNFKPKPWRRRPRRRPVEDVPCPMPSKTGRGVRRIAVGQELFATVDARDYKELKKHKWRLDRRGRQTYAACYYRGRFVYMHRMIMRPRKGHVVDHYDGNGLNNRRCNLRECTRGQNAANSRPRGGSSRFVGVRRHGDKWAASIFCRGRNYYLGTFDDEVEAARARDRKAWELHGPYAYLNFPEDFRHRRWRRSGGRKGR